MTLGDIHPNCSHCLTTQRLSDCYNKGYNCARHEIANGTASHIKAQQRENVYLQLTQDERIEWDRGYSACCIAHMLDFDSTHPALTILITDVYLIEDLLSGSGLFERPLRKDPREINNMPSYMEAVEKSYEDNYAMRKENEELKKYKETSTRHLIDYKALLENILKFNKGQLEKVLATIEEAKLFKIPILETQDLVIQIQKYIETLGLTIESITKCLNDSTPLT